jgi:hypothetical protein
MSMTDKAQARRLTLHIGIQRTGTTAIQRALAANRPALADQGVSYPFEKTNHQTIAWRLKRGTLSGVKLANKIAAFTDLPHVVLSAEDFCTHAELDWLEPLKARYEIRAVVYLRRQDHWVMSWYNQHVKWPFSRRHSVMTPQEFLGCMEEFHWLDYERLVERWETALGAGGVVARVVEAGQVTDTIGDFLGQIGVDRASLRIESRQQNDSLPPEMLEFARRAGMYDLPGSTRAAVIRLLQQVAKTAGCSAKTLYTADERRAVLDRFEASNNAVAQRWFGRERLFLEDPPDDAGLHIEGGLDYQGDIDAMIRREIEAAAAHGISDRSGTEDA